MRESPQKFLPAVGSRQTLNTFVPNCTVSPDLSVGFSTIRYYMEKQMVQMRENPDQTEDVNFYSQDKKIKESLL